MRSLQSYLFLGMHGAELSAYECVCRETILPAGPEPPARDQTESGTNRDHLQSGSAHNEDRRPPT
jgi:hypothetical protein